MVKVTVNPLSERIKEAVRVFVVEHINYPEPEDYLMVEAAMMHGANIALAFPAQYPTCADEDHVVAEIPGNYYASNIFRSDPAICSKCGTQLLGWYCPASSDHRCHYDDDTEDCSYCGMPDERK